MKKIFRKNQLVITALALMIAVAGYFSYMNNNMDDGKLQTAAEAANAEVSAGELEEDYDISDEDVLQNEIFTAEEPDAVGEILDAFFEEYEMGEKAAEPAVLKNQFTRGHFKRGVE